ncbi:tubulinyl-Tyr carboxypeptidase 1-like [Apostichopus japonicus]|uniref:tubulinyl-Tyr carboxypeptidase 1-like n=1 Tax=Stichopus japonicus TaxID=307972 RepID=UPI003AB34861
MDRDASKSDDEDDKSKEPSFTPGGVLFYVNKDGVPLSSKTLQKMWDHVAKVHPEGEKMVEGIQTSDSLPKVAIPQPPSFHPATSAATSPASKVQSIQHYMSQLQYNHTGMQFFEIKKTRPLAGLLEVAKDMIRESLPIKCLEAVILGIYLTNGTSNLHRFPISFKTSFSGHVHSHVVLGVCSSGRYGAMGMSRREDLMYKPLEFQSLSDLIYDFEESYASNFHTLRKVKIGWPVSHDPHSMETINWKATTLKMVKLSRPDVEKSLDKFVREMKTRHSWSSFQGSSYQHVKDFSPYSTSPRKEPFVGSHSLRNSRGYSPAVVFTSKDTEVESD